MSDVVRTGHTVRDKIYLLVKNVRPGVDEGKIAPAGSKIVWRGKTTEGHEDLYGGLLYWVELPDFAKAVGMEHEIDFVWDEE